MSVGGYLTENLKRFSFFCPIFSYLFGCVRSQLWHGDLIFAHTGFFLVVACRLYCCMACGILIP